MPGSLRKMPVWLPIVILLVAMASIQGGASLAKSLFPLVGAPGVTALRLALSHGDCALPKSNDYRCCFTAFRWVE